MTLNFQLFTSIRFDPSLLRVPHSDLEFAGWNFTTASPLYMLDLHRDRILTAAEFFGWEKAVEVLKGGKGLARLSDFILGAVGLNQRTPMRVKVLLTHDGSLSHEKSEVSERDLRNLFPEKLPAPQLEFDFGASGWNPQQTPAFEVVVDREKTVRSEFTHYKTTRREMYQSARRRAGIDTPGLKEVLIVNASDGSVMEGSITTVYLWRGGRWVTPPVGKVHDLEYGSGGQDGTTRRWILARGVVEEEVIKAETLFDGEPCWLSNGVGGFVRGTIRSR